MIKLVRNIVPIVLVLFLMASGELPQQTISGKVTSGGDPLPGVDVSIKGANIGTVTNMQGMYNLEANKIDTLVFSSLGYKDKTIAAAGKSTINVRMEEE